MDRKAQVGRKAEDLACDLLINMGYTIVKRNYRYKQAEVDIVCKKNGLFVFVEVKARSSFSFGRPEESVGAKKKRLMASAANNFVIHHRHEGDVRFDIIGVDMRIPAKPKLEHFEDAFFPRFF